MKTANAATDVARMARILMCPEIGADMALTAFFRRIVVLALKRALLLPSHRVQVETDRECGSSGLDKFAIVALVQRQSEFPVFIAR